ncbi:MAG TPA: fasciclin domain-containing protein [Acidimicrobiales bacterium]|nr:fasciclin domain-containing protein [Acidimicrobiales bacterium]
MRNRTTIKVAAALFAGTLLFAACSSDGDDEAATTTEAPTETTAAPEDDAAAEQNIVETAVAAGDFTTLVTAVEAADLAGTLSGEGPFTVFAPTDDAFAALPEGALDDLLADPEALADVLTYHVVDGDVMSTDLSDGMEVEALNGDTLTITIDGDTVKVNDATVTTADIETSNGVIHVIDTVLLPPAN